MIVAAVLVIVTDVRDVESVLRHFGKLDILVANAGAITLFTPREEYPPPHFASFAYCNWGLVLNKKDPNAWWNMFEVNIRGVFNSVRCFLHHCDPNTNTFLLDNTLKTTAFGVALPALEKTQGYIIAITSLGGQRRVPGGSDGCISKHAVNRLVEFVTLGKNFIPFLPFFPRNLLRNR